MTDKLFDNFIKERLQNYQSPVPQGLWEKIIAEDERKPKAIWWWNNKTLGLAMLLLLSIAGGGYWMLHSSEKKPLIAGNEKPPVNSIDASNTMYNKVTEQQNQNKYSNTDNNTSKALHRNGNKNEIQNLKDKLSVSTEAVIQKSSPDNATETNLSSTDKAGFMVSGKPGMFKANNYNNASSHNYSGKKTASYSSLNLLGEVFAENDFMLSSNKIGNGTTVLNPFKLEFTNPNVNAKTVQPFFRIDDCPTTRGIFRNDFYVEGYASPDFAFKNVTSTKSGNDSYLQKKDSSETMRLGFTVGARFSKSLTNNLLLKAGLQYSQFNEKLTLRTENERKLVITVLTHYIIRPGQPDSAVNDTSYTMYIGYRVRTNINRYKNLELPIMLSYEMGKPESKWKFAVNAGAIVNLTSWYDGKTFDSENNLVSVSSKGNNGFYQHKIGLSLYGSISVFRSITDEIDVFAEPYFRYGLSNSMQSTGGFGQKFNVAGLQLGARLRLSKNKHL